MNIAKAIKMCRQQQNLTLQDVATKAGVSKTCLHYIELKKRNPTLNVIEKIALGLNVPLALLVFLGSTEKELKGIDPELIKQFTNVTMELLRNE